ncbi:MAG: Asp-tRNA(Asn)/Glu-tRNA(Gln) amidotransferase subunit GatC, partial [Salibacteraceae bacterium]|nr:Asp-tRNA(Asn)/Glu-tRNA(Gln) amidotransferase subunit GatC [Salibacteraceae bacterium]MDP4964520.1 Asp-tRNA(Asn)/Glu-tRNA(Gln) amidotransferase subunit GatC [Salibacteraceae bacterium]
MEITDKTIDKLADLARLNFEGERKAEIKQDLERMLNFVDKLNELNTDGLEPLVYMTNEPLVLRKDEIGEELTQA